MKKVKRISLYTACLLALAMLFCACGQAPSSPPPATNTPEASTPSPAATDAPTQNSPQAEAPAQTPKPVIPGEPLEAGMLAPDFTVGLLSGETVTLSDLRGQVVLLNFWATWCPPCVGEMPDIQKIHDDYKDKGVAVIGISVGELKSDVQGFIDQNGFDYPIGLDEYADIYTLYPSDFIPYTAIIDANGVITHILNQRGEYEDFEARILAAQEGA